MIGADSRTTVDPPSDKKRPQERSDETGRELRPAGRYEWEQIIRRARLGDLIKPSTRRGADGRPTKGGMAGLSVTGIALCLATFANDKGAEVFPGDATVAVCMETTIKAVAAVRRALVDLGMLSLVRGRRGRYGDEYRLTLPSDLLDRLDVLTPAQLELAAGRLRDKARGRDRWGGPPDTPKRDGARGDGARVGPPDHPENDADPGLGGSAGPAESDLGWSAGPEWGGPPDPRTDHDRTSTTTDHAEIDLRTAVTGPRAKNDGPEDQDSIGELRTDDTASPPADPERCPEHPLMRGGLDDRDLPRCPLCRRLVVPRDVPVWLQGQPEPKPAPGRHRHFDRSTPASSPALAPAVNGAAVPPQPDRRAAFTLIQGGSK